MGLSAWQLKRQLAWLASQAAWVDTPQALVFSGGAFVSEDLEGNFRLGSADIDGPAPKGGSDNAVGIAPFCRVQLASLEWDRNSNAPRIERAVLRLWTTAGGGAVPGTPSTAGFDGHGINQVTGVNRAAVNPLGKSQGRDVDELIGRLAEKYPQFIDSTHGFQGRMRVTDAIRKVNGSLVLKRMLEVEVFNCLLSNVYPGATGASVGIFGAFANLFFTPPIARFDSLAEGQGAVITGALRRGASAGAPAPTTPSGGVVPGSVTSPGVGQFTVNQGIGAGTYNYSYWPGYAETPAGQLAQVADHFATTRVTFAATT